MVEQIPGFTVRAPDEDERGLGQGGTNLLINGERITSKDTDVLELLDNTPATAVERIEVFDAATLGVTGLTGQVANIIIVRNEMSGSFRYSPDFRDGTRPLLTSGVVSLTGKRGELSYTLGLSNRSSRGFEEGPEVVTFFDGSPPEFRDEVAEAKIEAPTITAAVEMPLGGRTTLALRGGGQALSVEQTEFSSGFDEGQRFSKFSTDEWSANGALELAYKRESGGTAKLIASQSYYDAPSTTRIEATDSPFFADFDAVFEREDVGGESILRTEYGWQDSKQNPWEIAAEAVYNFLESDTSLAVNDGVPDVRPTTTVEELRAESSITRGLSIGSKLAIQLSLAAEWSRIEAESGANLREDDFFRPKGLLTASYPIKKGLDLRARIERTVSQLNFGDFVEIVDLTEERDRGGNIDLVPEQAWETEIELQRNFTANEKVIFRLEGAIIEDRIERVPVESSTGQIVDAVGNVDGAQFAAATIEGTVFTKRWGLDGGRIDFSGTRLSSVLDEPLDDGTLSDEDAQRQFSLVQEWAYALDFRHDIPQTTYAWGASVNNSARRTVYRIDEVSWAETPDPNVSVFFEHKDFFGLNLVVAADNLLNLEDVRERTIWDGPRFTSDLNRIESRERVDNQIFSFTLSGTF